ncbi:testis-expressed protein 10 homolog [Ylistrum balloti]|uniref:testis-expressed protein 10 homolog n=1 Tax=Ylistrum balloti TaxID=509963 RepID=UPI002905CAE5|nr:testis-expressed protein 10 homolog [Ylistrum balloti]
MGKAKKKKRDFQKVKLKVGKQLKKADNVTTGSFQTRSIQVIQHLKSNDSQPSTKRNLNIKELLTQCQHYSISVRHDALTGMRELLTTYPNLIRSHLAVVLERAASMFSDKDAAVRQADIKLLKTILPHISQRQISSFFPIISAHLCCSMSHIYDEIQADSLRILDLFIENFPQLVIGSSNQLLANFIEQISSSQTTGDKKRTLNVNPNRKTTSQKWRSTVLERLHKLLSAVIKYQLTGKTMENQESDEPGNLTTKSCGKTVKWERDSNSGRLPIPQTFLSRIESSGMHIRSGQISNKKSTEEGYALTGEGGMEKLVQVLVPLLLECWIEAEGSHHMSNKKSHSKLISQESLGIRGSVLQVIQLLWRCVDINNPALMATMQKKYLADFKSQFLQNFPYAVHLPAERAEKVKKQSTEVQPSATSLNLAVCDIMAHFMSQSSSQLQDSSVASWESDIISYLDDVIQEEELSLQDQHIVMSVINRLMSQYKDQSIHDSLLQQMLNRYTGCHLLSSQRKELLTFFSDIFLDYRYEDLINSNMAITFLKTLPEVFFQAISNRQILTQVLMVMKKAVSQSKLTTSVMEIVQHFVDQVLDQSPAVFDKLESSTQKRFAELLYYIPPLQGSSLSSIVRLFRRPQVSVDICLYILQILHHRYMKEKQTVEGGTHYISTLLSILITHDDGNEKVVKDQETETTFIHRHGNHHLHCHFNPEIWNRSLILIKAVCSTYQQVENTSQVAEILESFLQSYLIQFQSEKSNLSSQNLMAIVMLASHMNCWKCPIGRKLTELVCGYIWCLFNILVANGEQISDFIQELKTECAEFVISAESGVKDFLENMSQDYRSACDEGDVQRVCGVASILLRYKGSLSTLHQHADSINTILTSVQTKFPSVLNKQWWSDFLYLVSLVS